MASALDQLIQDLRYAFRMLRRSPGFTVAAVLSLALGIGANTAIFSLIDAVLLRPLQVRDPAGLVAIGDQSRVNGLSQGGVRSDVFSWPLYTELRRRDRAFESIYANGRTDGVTEGAGDMKLHSARLVSGSYFNVLGVNPVIGRFFSGEDADTPGRTPVVVISYAYWQRGFQRNPGVVGRRLLVNNYPMTIAAVAPRGFQGDVVGANPDMWIPIGMEPQMMQGRDFLKEQETCWLVFMGRLRPGISFAQARAQTDALIRQIVLEQTKGKASVSEVRDIRQGKLFILPGASGFSPLRHRFSGGLEVSLALVGMVLLIACGNLANLLLARATARRKEMAIRLAIGARRSRVLRQLVAESLMLAIAGGLVALMIAFWASQGLILLTSISGNTVLDTSPDARIFLFTFGIALITGVLFGLAPAIRAATVDVSPVLRETARGLVGGGGRITPGRVLVVAQVAVSALLVFGAGLFVRTLVNLETQDFGFAKERLLMLGIDALGSGYKDAALPVMSTELVERLRRLPGVEAAAVSENGLFSGTESNDELQVSGFTPRSDKDLETNYDRVGPGYFETIGAPVLLGRGIEASDGPTSPKVAVVNQSMAAFYYPGQNPVGRQFRINSGKDTVEIVGVSRDVHDHEVRDQPTRRFYLAWNQFSDQAAFNFEIRAKGDPAALTASVRDAVKQFNPAMRIFGLDTAEVNIQDTVASDVMVARLSAMFGLIALALAAFGLYGLLSYTVARRTAEIGIRMALGASRRGVLWMMMGEALALAGIGLAVGVPAAIATGQLIASNLFGVIPADPDTLALSAATILAVTVFAAWLPARRAAGVDPMYALRYE